MKIKFNKDNFFKKVYLFHAITDEDCWEWTGAKDKDGYGRFGGFKEDGKFVMCGAHRVFWMMFKGEIPDGMHALHECDQPSCVNGSHLFLGTNLDNIKDMDKKGRRKFGVTTKLTEAQVLEIINTPKYLRVVTDLSEKFKVGTSVISEIRSGKAWKHLSEKLIPTNP